jgi:putative glutamine amidotransferase
MSLLRIGFSACFFHADPQRNLFKGKTLLYMEESIAHWIFHEKALGFLIPTVHPNGSISLQDIVSDLDGLVLQGGSDVSPKNYGEEPLKPEWAGDYIRDQYEIALVKECVRQKKPILGICRGAQLLNVAFGGSLYQDINTQIPEATTHRHWETYEQNFHEVAFQKGSLLETTFKSASAKVNSIHHQAIKKLGKDLKVEAVSKDDNVIEAIRLDSEPFVYAFQWHPEFHDPKDKSILDCRPILREFLRHAKNRREKSC